MRISYAHYCTPLIIDCQDKLLWYSIAIMIWLLLTVILTVPQTAPPIPGKTADNTAQTRQNAQNQGTSNKRPAVITQPAINTEATAKDKNSSGDIRTENNQQTVRISEWPPVSITKGWTDYTYWFFSLCLVVVGGLQIWLLNRTLGAIKSQADSMARQIALQEIAIQQWVETENWEGSSTLSQNRDIIYNIIFYVVNPSLYPLTLTTICGSIWSYTFNINDEIFLVPGERYRVHTEITLSQEQANAGIADNLVVWVVYRDVFKKQKSQFLGKFCSFQGSMVGFSTYRGALPQLLKAEEEDEDEQELPN